MRLPKRADIAAYLWLEFRVASQYSETWAGIEERLFLQSRKKGSEPPSLEESSERGPGTFRWMQEVDIPAWFYATELGYGTKTAIEKTLSELCDACRNMRKCNAKQQRRCRNVRRRQLFEATPTE